MDVIQGAGWSEDMLKKAVAGIKAKRAAKQQAAASES